MKARTDRPATPSITALTVPHSSQSGPPAGCSGSFCSAFAGAAVAEWGRRLPQESHQPSAASREEGTAPQWRQAGFEEANMVVLGRYRGAWSLGYGQASALRHRQLSDDRAGPAQRIGHLLFH